jgi:hypothetical protein
MLENGLRIASPLFPLLAEKPYGEEPGKAEVILEPFLRR